MLTKISTRGKKNGALIGFLFDQSAIANPSLSLREAKSTRVSIFCFDIENCKMQYENVFIQKDKRTLLRALSAEFTFITHC